MSRPFFICALPRSRTAWLAAWLSGGDVACGHELSSLLGDPLSLVRYLATGRAQFAGNSDTLQALWLPQLLTLVPAAPVVVVRRPAGDVLRSLIDMGMPLLPEQLAPGMQAIEWASRQPNALTIDFEDLEAESAARAIHAHVAPGEEFDRHRWAMFAGLNIQVTPARARQIGQRIAATLTR